MTSDAQVAPDWVSLLAPKVRRGVEAAMAQNPAAYADALRRVTGGTAPLDKQTADTVASILIGSTVNSADVDIANAAVALGVHDNGAGLAPQRRIVSLAGKDLAIEALAPKTVRELNLGISSGTNFGQLVSNSLVEVLHTQVSKIFWDEFAKAFVTDGWSQVLWQSMIGEAFRNAANNKVRRALGLAATSGFEDFSTLAPDVTVTGAAKFITPWADNYANTQIENYDVMSARAVQDSLTRYMQQGLSQQAMASRIRASYGLDTKSAFALDAYRDTMLVQRPKQAGIIGKLVLGYADRLLKARTDMVGQTTAMTALNFGRLLVFTQAQARGDLPPDIQKVWVTAIDERVCPTCRPMDGTSIDMNEPFQVRFHSGARTHKKARAVLKEGDVTELLVPPSHPNCRCTIVLSTEFDQGLITRTARNAGRGLSVSDDKVLAKAFNPDQMRDEFGRWIKKPEVIYSTRKSGISTHFDAHKDGKNIGYLTTYPEDDHIWFSGLYVHPEHRRQGVADALMQRAVDHNKDKVMKLKADPYREVDDESALIGSKSLSAFYKKFGFKPEKGQMVRRPSDISKVWQDFEHPRGMNGRFIAELLNSAKGTDYSPDRTLHTAAEGIKGRELHDLISAHWKREPPLPKYPYRPTLAENIKRHYHGNTQFLNSSEIMAWLRSRVKDVVPPMPPEPEHYRADMSDAESEAVWRKWDEISEVKNTEMRIEAAQKILDHPAVALINHPEYGESLLRFSAIADVWSNTHPGANAIKAAAAAADPAEFKILAETTREKTVEALDSEPIKILIDAIENAPKNAPVVYRGMALPKKFFDQLHPGDEFGLALSSFSSDESLGRRFSEGIPTDLGRMRYANAEQGLAAYAKEKIVPVLYQLEPGSHSLHISPVTFGTAQDEWLTRGRYVVKGIESDEGVYGLLKIVHIVQVASTVAKRDQTESPAIAILNSALPRDEEITKAWTEEEHPRDDKGKWSKKEVAYAAGGAAALLFAGRLASVAYHSNVAIKVSGSTFQELNDNAPALLQHIKHIYPGWRKASISDRLTGSYPAIFSQSLLRKFEGDSLEETLQKITEVAPTLSHEIGFFMDESGKILAGFRGARKGHPQVLMLHPKGLSAEDKSKTITFHTHPTTPRHNQTFSPPSPADMSQMFSERWGPNIIIDGKKNRYEFSWTGDAEGGGLVLRKIHDFELTNRIKLSSEAVKKNMTMDAANQRLMLELHQFYKKLAREVPNFHYRFTAGPIDISKDWKPDLHPRDAIGRFADKLGASSDASYAMLQRHGVGRYYIAHTPSWISHPQTAQDYARSVGAGAGLGIAIAAAVVAPGAIKGSGEFLIHFNDVTAAMEKAGSVFAKAGEYVPAIETNMKSWAEMMKEHIPSEEMRNIGIGIHYKRGLEYAWMDKLAPDPTGRGASSWLDGATGEFVDGSKVRFQAMGKKWLSYLPEDWHQSIKQLYDSGVELDKKTGLTSRERNLDEDAFFTMDQVMNMYHGAVTSNFKRSTTQMFQLAAAKALNLKDAPTWHFAAGPVRRREMMNRARHFNIADRFKTLETAGNLDLGDAIKARYALTQEMLTDMGMDEIHLARGMTITEAQAKKMGLKIIDEIDGPLRDKDATAWQRVTTGLQPINSFTDNPKTAFEYATSVTPKRGNVAVVVRAVFPKDRIFMEGGGGPTGEWMVLGGKTELEAVAFRPGFLDKLTPFDPENPSGFASPDDLNSELGKLWDSNITKIKKWWRRVTRQK